MKLSDLRRFLASLGIRPRKSLSQNFLIDQNILEKTLQLAGICPSERVLEIGPGAGMITRGLLERGAHVIAVEYDRVLAEKLRELDIELIEGDALKVALPPFDKVVSNLPFHITAPLMALLLPLPFSTMTLFVQEEVARRMVAGANTKEYGAFSLLIQFYSEAKYAFRVPRNCFYPVPKVECAVVQLTKIEPPAVNREAFFNFVHTTFQGRRKRVATTWRKKYGVEIACEARPENLTLEQFLDYYAQISQAQSS